MSSSEFWTGRRVVVTGGQGFLGSGIMDRLRTLNSRPVSCSRRSRCDLRYLAQALAFFEDHQPQMVINCAAHHGGIGYRPEVTLLGSSSEQGTGNTR